MAILDIPLTNVQPTLVSGTNIKTINGTSILGSGNLVIASGISIGDTIGSGTAGSVLFLGAAGVLAQDNANFFWDDANNRLGIETNTPSAKIHAKAASATDIAIIAQGTTAQTGNLFEARDVGGTVLAKTDANGAITAAGFYTSGLIAMQYGSLMFEASNGNFYLNSDSFRWGNGKGLAFYSGATNSGSPDVGLNRESSGLLRVTDGSTGYADLAIRNLVSNTGSGIQLATAATQKISFWGATPVTRAEAMATSISYSSIGGTSVRANDTWGGYTILTAIATLKGLGILP